MFDYLLYLCGAWFMRLRCHLLTVISYGVNHVSLIVELFEHHIRGWRAVSAAGNAWPSLAQKELFFTETRMMVGALLVRKPFNIGSDKGFLAHVARDHLFEIRTITSLLTDKAPTIIGKQLHKY